MAHSDYRNKERDRKEKRRRNEYAVSMSYE